jgi:hypothetical protein
MGQGQGFASGAHSAANPVVWIENQAAGRLTRDEGECRELIHLS